MKKWEYRLDKAKDITTGYLNECGAEGWELVAWDHLPVRGIFLAVFKREITEKVEE